MHESQRPTLRLVLGETGQLCSQRIDLGAELTTAPQRGIHILTTHRRQLGTRERVAPCRDSGARMAASLVEQLGVDALLPGRRSSISAQYSRPRVRISTTCAGGIHDSGNRPSNNMVRPAQPKCVPPHTLCAIAPSPATTHG
jgi:hypothetical protein